MCLQLELTRRSLYSDAIFEVIESITMNNPLSAVGSTYLLKKNLVSHCGLVEPKEVQMGIVYKGDGQAATVKDKQVYAQVIPFKDSLSQILSNISMYNMIFNSNHTESTFYESIKDGSEFKNNTICKKYKNNALLLQLYEDDIEVVNPLGANVKKHKLLNMYFTILNLPEYVRSNLKSISLLSIAKSKYVKEFGREACLKDFLDGVAQLESDEGLSLKINGQTITLHGTLLCVAGDNLSMNHLGGFKVGFAFAKHPCRHCMIEHCELSKFFCEGDLCLRNENEHRVQLEALADKTVPKGELDARSIQYGVVGPSILSRLKYIDVTKMLPPDIMHNLWEGVCDIEIKALLFYLIEELAVLSLDQINYLLDSFPYAPEISKNKPSKIEKQHLKEDGQLRQSASQTSVLLIVLPIVLSEYVSTEDKRYMNFILLVQISQLLLAFKVKKESIPELRQMIYEHNSQFVRLYPHISYTPKFHFLLHGPSVIEMFGATRNAWCMRFESRHAWFVRVAARTNNFKNIEKTLAYRFQVKHALDFELGNTNAHVLDQNAFTADSCKTISRNDVPLGSQIANLLMLEKDELLCCTEEIHINNFALQQGRTLLVNDHVGRLPQFGKISALFTKGGLCCAVLQLYSTKEFSVLKNAYLIKETNNFLCQLTENLPSVQTFPTVSYKNAIFVTLMYYDRTEFLG